MRNVGNNSTVNSETWHYEEKGEKLFIKKENLNKINAGGTSVVYKIINGNSKGKALKLYKDIELEKRGREFYNKLVMMIESKPKDIYLPFNTSIPQFAWPESIVFGSNGKLSGYIMPFVNSSEFYHLDEYIHETGKLDAKHQNIYERVQVTRNLAGALSRLHQNGHYFIDMKPSNIKVHKKLSTVVFYDTDGFSIANGQFPAQHSTPRYTAPEFLGKVATKFSNNVEQDLYVLAMLIFEILDFGNQPWNCRILENQVTSNLLSHTQEQRAKNRMYAYARNPMKGILPNEKSIYRYWPFIIRDSLEKAFLSNSAIGRPTANQWFEILNGLVVNKNNFLSCNSFPNKPSHTYFSGSKCFVCNIYIPHAAHKSVKIY